MVISHLLWHILLFPLMPSPAHITCVPIQDKERTSRFHQSLIEEQKARQMQERTQLQRSQRAEAKGQLAQLKLELRKQGLSSTEQKQRLSQVGSGYCSLFFPSDTGSDAFHLQWALEVCLVAYSPNCCLFRVT